MVLHFPKFSENKFAELCRRSDNVSTNGEDCNDIGNPAIYILEDITNLPTGARIMAMLSSILP